MEKTIKLFFVKCQSCYTFGRQGQYFLNKPSIEDEWVTEYTCILPDGYKTALNQNNELCIYNKDDESCPAVPDGNENPVLMDGINFIKLHVI